MKSILVATDFSNNANNALNYANAFAEATQHKLILLNVYQPSVGQYNAIHGIIAEETALAQAYNFKKLKASARKLLTVGAEEHVLTGNTIDEILNTSKKRRCNFIIMGTHGASGLKKAFIGSNTTKVIANAEVPVLAIPPRFRFNKIETIVYASDLKNTLNELKAIIPIAKLLNASIEIVSLKYNWDHNEIQKSELEKRINRLSFKNIQLVERKATIEKTMTEQLKAYLQKRKPSMLAMFPEDKSWFEKLFNSSKTEELAYELKIPLLSIRKSLVK